MRIKYITLGLVYFLLFTNDIHTQSDHILAMIEAETQDMPDGTEFSLGHYQNGEWTHCGYKIKDGQRIKIDNSNKLFEIGSITKTFTATLIMEMIEKGLLQLSDPITLHLPVQMVKDSFQNQTVTIQHLLTHTSGLSPSPSSFTLPYLRALIFSPKNPNRNFKAKHYYKYLRKFELDYLPGREWNYNNSGYGLLGEIIENKYDQSWSKVLEDKILVPLKMDATCVRITKSNKGQLVTGITAKGKKSKPWEMDFIDPAGAIKSTLTDMIHYVDAQLSAKTSSPFLAAQDNLENQIQMPESSLWHGNAMGLGWWNNLEVDDHHFLWHGGSSGGYTSFVGFSSTQNEAVIILSNVSSSHPQARAENRIPKIMLLGQEILRRH